MAYDDWERDTWGFAEGDEIAPGRHAVRLLGGGRRYEAYLVWDDELHSLVVAKVVRPGQTANERTLAGLAGEAEALSRLAHPSLVRCFDSVLDGERPHLVLELLDGPRLSTLERRYGIIVEQLLPLALQLCSALHYMHGQGWAHLDVKPRNIIMSSTPKLIDLSVALPFEDARRSSSPIGTDAYMAPEQCDPARFEQIGAPSDSWGLGVTLYEALAAARPFPDGDPDGRALSRRAIRSSRTNRGRSTRTCCRRFARSCSPASTTILARVRFQPRSPTRSSRSSPCFRCPASAASGPADGPPDPRRRLYEDGLTPPSWTSNRARVFLFVDKESNG